MTYMGLAFRAARKYSESTDEGRRVCRVACVSTREAVGLQGKPDTLDRLSTPGLTERPTDVSRYPAKN